MLLGVMCVSRRFFFLSILVFLFWFFVLLVFFCVIYFLFFFFFFSSRRRHTRWNCDWSSDVCSSDLSPRRGAECCCVSDSIPAIVLGGTGYVAGELLRLLAGHPNFQLAGVMSDKIGRASCRERV